MSKPPPDLATAMADLDANQFVDAETLATILRVGRALTYRSLQDGSIPSVKLGNRYRVSSAWVRSQLSAD